MSISRNMKKRVQRKIFRVRNKVVKNCLDSKAIRISVFRSLKYFYAQAIDDARGETVLSCSSLASLGKEQNKSKNTIEVAKQLGNKFGEDLLKNNITKVVFDRGNLLYHGRVKAFVEGMREQGVKI